MAGIFISYRRDDSDIAAGRLSEDLSAIFGADSIFRDIDSLDPGVDYEQALDSALSSCVILIAMIGSRWSAITDRAGRRRLEDPQDWVRAEIETALKRGVRVLPVLVSGAVMPREEEVPPGLGPLVKRQALELDDRHWKQDLELLTQALRKVPGIAGNAPVPPPLTTVKSKVKLVGSKQWFMINPQAVVFIDGKEVTRMRLLDEVAVDVEPGRHTVYARMLPNSSNTETFDSLPGKTQAFRLSVNRITGTLKLEPLAE